MPLVHLFIFFFFIYLGLIKFYIYTIYIIYSAQYIYIPHTLYIIYPLFYSGPFTKKITIKITITITKNTTVTILKSTPIHILSISRLSVIVYTYLECDEKLAAAKMAASTSTLSWESRLCRMLWWAFFLSGIMEAKLPNILSKCTRHKNICIENLYNHIIISKHILGRSLT